MRAFSVVELVVIAVILVLVAALSIPRSSQAAGADCELQLRAELKVLRNAIELYYYDHGHWPAQKPDGIGGAAGDPATALRQLTGVTNRQGHVIVPTFGETHFGPYLADGVPPCPAPPVIGKHGLFVISGEELPRFSPSAAEAGWVYNCETGAIAANSNLQDGDGLPYDRF